MYNMNEIYKIIGGMNQNVLKVYGEHIHCISDAYFNWNSLKYVATTKSP